MDAPAAPPLQTLQAFLLAAVSTADGMADVDGYLRRHAGTRLVADASDAIEALLADPPPGVLARSVGMATGRWRTAPAPSPGCASWQGGSGRRAPQRPMPDGIGRPMAGHAGTTPTCYVPCGSASPAPPGRNSVGSSVTISSAAGRRPCCSMKPYRNRM